MNHQSVLTTVPAMPGALARPLNEATEMNHFKYISLAMSLISKVERKEITGKAARASWNAEAVSEEPCLAFSKSVRSVADIVADLEKSVMWLKLFAHAEALENNEQRDRVEYPAVNNECIYEARLMNRSIGHIELIATSGFCQADRAYMLSVTERRYPNMLKHDVEVAHAEALEINQCFDFNVQQSELAAKQQWAVLERLD